MPVLSDSAAGGKIDIKRGRSPLWKNQTRGLENSSGLSAWFLQQPVEIA